MIPGAINSDKPLANTIELLSECSIQPSRYGLQTAHEVAMHRFCQIIFSLLSGSLLAEFVFNSACLLPLFYREGIILMYYTPTITPA